MQVLSVVEEELVIKDLLLTIKNSIIENKDTIILEKDKTIEKLVIKGDSLLEDKNKTQKKLRNKNIFNNILIGTNITTGIILCLVLLI